MARMEGLPPGWTTIPPHSSSLEGIVTFVLPRLRHGVRDSLRPRQRWLAGGYHQPPSPRLLSWRDTDFVNQGMLLDEIRERCMPLNATIALVSLGGVG
jgi:hypothetical protein